MEIVQELQTRESTRKKAAALFGFDQPRAVDVIHREDFATDAEYAVALAQMEMTMSTPEYQRAIRKATVENRQRAEEEEAKANLEEYAKIRESVTLNSFEQSQVEEKARLLAMDDFRAGKIHASDLGTSAIKHFSRLEKEALDQKASNMHFNSMIRQERNKSVVVEAE